MARYRNIGAPFTRDDAQTIWESGEVAEPTPRELAMRHHKLVLEEGEEPEPEPVADPLEGVLFGSADAEKLARKNELTAADFEGVLGEGEEGAFLVGDVRALLPN